MDVEGDEDAMDGSYQNPSNSMTHVGSPHANHQPDKIPTVSMAIFPMTSNIHQLYLVQIISLYFILSFSLRTLFQQLPTDFRVLSNIN